MSVSKRNVTSLSDAIGPELLRAQKKDDGHVAQLSQKLASLAQKLLGPRTWIEWCQELDLMAQFAYYGSTTLFGLQTLGEEYMYLIQARNGDNGPTVPSFKRRLCFVAMQILGPYFFDKSFKYFIKLYNTSCRPQTDDDDSGNPENCSIISSVLHFLKRNGSSYCCRLHLAFFYLFGQYYLLSKRFAGVRYLSMRDNDDDEDESVLSILKTFRILGYISLFEMTCSLTIFLWHFTLKRAKKKEELDNNTQGMATVFKWPRKQAQGRLHFSCDLCANDTQPPCCTPCGHLFCWKCLISQATVGNRTCPVCRSSIQPSRIIPLMNL